jgi:hypothetical protein
MKDTLKAIWNSRIGMMIIAFVVGGIFTYLFLPEKIVIKTEIKEVEKIVTKTIVKWKTKEVIKEVKVRSFKHKITWPDGKIEEWDIVETDSQELTKMQETYNELLKEAEKTLEEKYSKTITNPKYLTVYGGIGSSLSQLQKPFYLGGFNYTIWGPLTIGAQASSQPSGAFTIGLRF